MFQRVKIPTQIDWCKIRALQNVWCAVVKLLIKPDSHDLSKIVQLNCFLTHYLFI